jgi:hypothetical protein
LENISITDGYYWSKIYLGHSIRVKMHNSTPYFTYVLIRLESITFLATGYQPGDGGCHLSASLTGLKGNRSVGRLTMR